MCRVSTCAGLVLEQQFFFNESLINKLNEYEAIFEQLFFDKKLFDFKSNFNYLFYTYFESSFRLSKVKKFLISLVQKKRDFLLKL